MDDPTGSMETYLASQRRLQEIGQRCSDAFAVYVAAAIPAWEKASAGFAAAVRNAVTQIAAVVDRWQPYLDRWRQEDARRAAESRWHALSRRQRKDVARRHRKGIR